jgi:outer membrane protein OmpA-like peptidoglycan-associated protein
VPSASAHGYEVRIAGRVVCRTNGPSCVLPRLLTAAEHVVVTALGGASTRSVATLGRHTLGRPLLLAVVHFATGSHALSKGAARTLVAAETKIRRYGFIHAYLTCHTDNAGTLRYNVALSRARCAAVARFVRRRLGIATVTYTESAFAYLRPVAPNTSRSAMARNRRVEISVR